MSSDQDWINGLFDKNPDAQNVGLADKMGVGRPVITKIRNGTRKIKFAEVAIIREYFDQFSNNNENQLDSWKNAAIPKISGPIQTPDGETANYALTRAQSIPFWDNTQEGQLAYFEVKEESLTPDFNPGDKIIVDLGKNTVSTAGVYLINHQNRACVCFIDLLPDRINEVSIRVGHNEDDKYTLPVGELKIIGQGAFVGKKL